MVLLLIPPFTQMNTPYPSTAYLKGYLQTQGIDSRQADLSLEVILALYSQRGLTELFDAVGQQAGKLSRMARRMCQQRERYLQTIDPVIAFLQGKSDTLAYRICHGDYLPQARHHGQEEEELEWAFGTLGLRDKARFLATRYLEELATLIQETVDPEFGFSRYAEHLGRCASSFTPIEEALQQPERFTDRFLLRLLQQHIEEARPSLVAISIPFPGNLYSALRCGQWIKAHYPDIPVAFGGGFVNTELRSITDPRLFRYGDYLLFDDGELPLRQLVRYVTHACQRDALRRTACLEEGEIRFYDNPTLADCHPHETGTPDYSGLWLDRYLSVTEIANPMHKLWSDGRWNKLTLAHGCYWGKCTFCDGSLDYIKRYVPAKATVIADRMEQLIAQTGEIGFHFVDEAAPPALLRELAQEIIRRKLTVVWWGNIRFEKSFTRELCDLLRQSGCIAVSGGLEVASPRLLKLINKGVTVPQVAQVTRHFSEAGILVHAYLMYGFPTETAQETIDSLEIVRQLFALGLVQSGFWHRFAMTAHSPVGLQPEAYHCRVTEPPFGGFARNDIQFEDLTGTDHDLFGEGLRISMYNFMNGTGFDLPLHKWFGGIRVPRTTLPPNYIERCLAEK
ncbi:MAG: B12-binding domain-containing radical SAM protein [Parabacteroides sp.]